MSKKAISLLFGALLIAGFLVGCGAKKTDEVVEKTTDPTCGMEVAITADAVTLEHDGKTEYFCSEDCKVKFVADPAKYMETHHEEMHEGM